MICCSLPHSKQKRPKALTLSLSFSTAHLTIESSINADLSRLEKSDFTHKANITANNCHRDDRRIGQPLIAWLWLKACYCRLRI